jgi:hypothetical protein
LPTVGILAALGSSLIAFAIGRNLNLGGIARLTKQGSRTSLAS